VLCGADLGGPTGSRCLGGTSANALAPGTTTGGARAIWEIGQVRVTDEAGGLFLTQGLFVP